MSALLISIGQGLALILLAPLLQGFIKTSKARLQGRQGPPLFQSYYDLAKLLRKEAVLSQHASPLIRLAPYASLGALVAVAFMVPVLSAHTTLGFAGGAIAAVYLLALARFVQALAALDSASAFGGMGASREMMVGALVEPGLLLAWATAAVHAGNTHLGLMAHYVASAGLAAVTPAHVLALAAFALLTVAEVGRLPFDNPDTHLELTMLHEGMLLEYSGRHLSFLFLAAQLKQMLLLSLLIALFLPWGMALEVLSPLALSLAALGWLAKLAVLGLALAVIEMLFAKLRLFRVPNLLAVTFALGAMALLATILIG